MDLEWIDEHPPVWDAGKARVVGGAPPGVFDLGDVQPGDPLPGEWWRVEDGGEAVAYGWIDTVWGDAEMLLAVDPSRQRTGVGSFVLDHLEREAAKRGLNYICNVVRPTHPDGERVTAWLCGRGFEPAADGLLRRRVTAS
jgi:ribosomal protein S18 acetylase RimI-like enzyme